MRWSENETCHFVKLYLQHELLWNTENFDNKCKFKRLKAYRDIIIEFHKKTGIRLNEAEVKIKIKNLRSTYVQEKAKIRQRSSSEWTYKPNMRWFADWDKCFGRLTKFTDRTSFNTQDSAEDPCQKIWLSSNNDNIEDETLDPIPHDESLDAETDDDYTIILKSEPQEDSLLSGRGRYESKKKKNKIQSPSTDYSDSFRNSMDSGNNMEMAKEDEFDIYGKYIATQLRKMDLQKALRVQLEIQGLVSEARISGLTEH